MKCKAPNLAFLITTVKLKVKCLTKTVRSPTGNITLEFPSRGNRSVRVCFFLAVSPSTRIDPLLITLHYQHIGVAKMGQLIINILQGENRVK